MSSLDLSSGERTNSQNAKPASGWRILCVSPNRLITEELIPVLGQSLAGSSIIEIRAYPEIAELRRAFTAPASTLLFLDVITDRERALALMAEIVKADKSIPVIAILSGNEPQLILRCLRQGAGEFLLRPFSPAQLDTSLNKLWRTLPKDKQPVQKDVGKIYCVMPAKGACGATTVASNLAFQLKRSGASRVLLADLDPLTGTISFLLKIKSTYSFLDVLSRVEGLDEDLWKAMVSQRQGVDVLLAPEIMFDGASELRDAGAVIEYAKTNYDAVILDAASVYGEWNLSQARVCDELLLVTTNELPALQATQRALSYLEANRIGRWKIKVVVNRYHKDVGLSRDVIATALHTDVFHVVPSDYESVQKSLLEGKPVPSTSSLGRSFNTLSDRLLGRQKKETPKSTSSIGSLLSLFSRTSS